MARGRSTNLSCWKRGFGPVGCQWRTLSLYQFDDAPGQGLLQPASKRWENFKGFKTFYLKCEAISTLQASAGHARESIVEDKESKQLVSLSALKIQEAPKTLVQRYDLTLCIYYLVLGSKLPQKSATYCLRLLVNILSRRFCGGVDFLKLIDKYFLLWGSWLPKTNW